MFRRIAAAATLLSGAGATLSIINLLTIPRLRLDGLTDITESVTVCIPARNEVDRLPDLLRDLAAQQFCPHLQVFVLDDDSTDGTAAAAREAVGNDSRFHIETSRADPPTGWTGKAAACATLARSAPESTLIAFIDADVRLAPNAIAATASAIRDREAALLCPWPVQETRGALEQLIQPLLAWSWMITLPVSVANATTLPSMAVACGQFMMFDAVTYRAAGGHGAVAASLAEDLDIARLLRSRGERTVIMSSARSVSCRMYQSAAGLRNGYTRWLWQAFAGPFGSATVAAVAALAFLVPPVAMTVGTGATRRWGVAGYAAGVTSRFASRRMEYPGADASALLQASAHPFSIGAFVLLLLDSHRRASAGRLGWKNRPISAALPDDEAPIQT